MCKKRFAIAIPVDYPGDFQFAGGFWRAVTVVQADDPMDATHVYANLSRPPDTATWDYFIATDFDPALDVLDARFERIQS